MGSTVTTSPQSTLVNDPSHSTSTHESTVHIRKDHNYDNDTRLSLSSPRPCNEVSRDLAGVSVELNTRGEWSDYLVIRGAWEARVRHVLSVTLIVGMGLSEELVLLRGRRGMAKARHALRSSNLVLRVSVV